MDERPLHLVMIPGMGADARLFEPQRAAFPGMHIVPWIEPQARESFAAYARRMARLIATERPLVLVGVSLGGMLAVQVAEELKARGVVLVASCRSRKAISPLARPLERCARLLPDTQLRAVRSRGWGLRVLFGELGEAERSLVLAMLGDASVEFLRWAGRAILQWEGPGDLSVPVRHIHGARDRIIPVRRVQPDRIVPDAGHLLNITHPREVNAFISDALARWGFAAPADS